MTTRKEIKDRVDTLIASLSALRAQRKEMPPSEDRGQDARFDAHQSLAAVSGFLNSIPEWQAAKLDFGLYPLLLAVRHIEQGGVVPWLSNGHPRPPVPDELKAARGRCAGAMDVLIRRGGYQRRPAAEFVARNLEPATFRKIAATSRQPKWGTIATWRDNATGPASQKFALEQDGFRSVGLLAEANDKPWPTFTKHVLSGIAEHTAAVTFEPTPL